MTNELACPCGSKIDYSVCCEKLIAGIAVAQTAQQLMRSRFSAFAKNEIDYLIATWHPSKRHEINRQSLLKTAESCDWLSLSILDTAEGQQADEQGEVEFLAIFKEEKLEAMQERSRFVKENGQWFYLGGVQKKPVLPGRNDPCWCGSGKKSKKCHGVVG